jgi:glycosyltransferase involved in cell wall biosynthesis
VFNLATDADDPALNFAVGWVEALAQRVGHVDVVTMRAGRYRLPRNVRVWSLGKERGLSEPRRAALFYRHLLSILRRRTIDACFSHMTPLFTIMAAPVLRPLGVPIVTWYAHRHVSWAVRVAHHLSDRVVASVPSAYRYRRDRLELLGQGIDAATFTPGTGSPESPPRVASVGRLSPIKDLATLIDAVAILRGRSLEVSCALVGEAPERDRSYAEGLRDRAGAAGVAGAVCFPGAAVGDALVDWYRRSTFHVNLAPTGAIDKAALEAMACGRPSLASNVSFADTFGRWSERLLFRQGDAADLAEKLAALLAMDASTREAMAAELRASVLERHSLDRLADRLVELLGELRRRPAAA